jgi:hypothetical protein
MNYSPEAMDMLTQLALQPVGSENHHVPYKVSGRNYQYPWRDFSCTLVPTSTKTTDQDWSICVDTVRDLLLQFSAARCQGALARQDFRNLGRGADMRGRGVSNSGDLVLASCSSVGNVSVERAGMD